MQIELVDDYPTDLIPLTMTRKCDRCGNYTWWATARQKTHGRCWDCVTGINLRGITAEHFERVFMLLLEAFPGAMISDGRTRRYRPGTYTGADAGPCMTCGGTIRRYGLDGHPRCLDCDAAARNSNGGQGVGDELHKC